MFTLGRKIDLSYQSNQLIMGVVLTLAVVGSILSGGLWSGLSLGLGVFITWALTRELDPAHDYSAFAAAALSLFMFVEIESTQFLPLFWLLLILRAVNGISGKALTILDLVLLSLFAGFMSWNNKNPVYLLLFVLAMVFVRLTSKQTKKVTIAGVLGFALFLIQSFLSHPLTVNALASLNTLDVFVILAAILSPILFWFLAKEDITDDQGNKANRFKIFAGQLFYCLSLLSFVFFTEISIANQVIYLAIIVGLFVYFIYDRLLIK